MKSRKLLLITWCLFGGWGCQTVRPRGPASPPLQGAGVVSVGPAETELDGGRTVAPQMRYVAISDGRSIYKHVVEPHLSSELAPLPPVPPLAAALLARYSELVGWGYPLIISYLPQDVELPNVIELSTGAVGPYKPHAPVLAVSIDTPAQSPDLVWRRLITELYISGLSNWADTELSPLGLNVAAVEAESVRSVQDLNQHLLTAVWRDGMATYVSAHGSRLTEDGVDRMAWQRRSEVSPHFMEMRAMLRPEGVPREIWQDLLRANASQRIFALTGAHMACRLERELGLSGLVAAVGRGPFAFYEAFMSLEPGALVSFELSQPISPAERVPLPPRVTH